MTHIDAYHLYLTDQAWSSRTVYARHAFASARLADWGTWDQAPEVITRWLNRHSGHTKRTYYDHFVALYRWLEMSGRLEPNPMEVVKRPPTPKPRPRPLSRDDAAQTLLAATGDLRAHLLLGRYAGLRAHEIAKFAGSDIDEECLYVFGKGEQGQVLPTHPKLWELAQQYPRRGYWFPSDRCEAGHIHPHTVTMRVSRHFASLGVAGASHRNRHLYGTELLRSGANVRVVQELMRHADLSTTVRYLGVDEDEKIRAVLGLSA